MALPSSLGRLPSYTNAPGAGGFEKLQNSPFGSGSLTAGLSQRIQQSGGLGDTRGIPVGRSTMNPERALGMMSRGTARPGQVEAALGLETLQRQRRQDAREETGFQQEQQRRDKVVAAYEQMRGGQTPTTGANPPATGGNAPPPPTTGANPPATGGNAPPPPTASGSAAPPPTAPQSMPPQSANNAILKAMKKISPDLAGGSSPIYAPGYEAQAQSFGDALGTMGVLGSPLDDIVWMNPDSAPAGRYRDTTYADSLRRNSSLF